MRLNTFIETSKSFTAVPDKDFIEERDKKGSNYRAGFMGADAEFPEYHQIKIDPLQKKYFNEKGQQYNADVVHEKYGICEYKQYSKRGFLISKNTERAIKNNIVEKIIVWKWSKNNRWEPLVEGKSVGYDIIGIIDAKEAFEKSYTLINENGKVERRCKLF